ncbi:MAG: phosphate/phosphite/phosphonate ABC transporter substrate-binding protein [Cyanobacteriota bacterium]|nr:phosphate/phosphite/phosphonate ABC transporter substrate-binding protein [Cyanobacteriota bacterium]
MWPHLISRTALVGFILFLSGSCTDSSVSTAPSTPSDPPTPSATDTLVLGDISDEPVEAISEAQPLADYLATRLEAFGIASGEVKIAPDMETMAEWLASGTVDVYMDSPYPALIVSERSGAKPSLRRWKDGIAQYNTVIFARTDSGVTSLGDLQGRAIGFDEEFSTSGYLLPLGYILKSGFQAIELQDTEAEVAPDRIGYIFTKEDENTIQWTISGKVAAGAIDAPNFEEIPETVRAELTTIAQTEFLPRQVVLFEPNMEPQLEAEISEALVSMEETPEGKSILRQFGNTSQFDRLPGQQDPLQSTRELYEKVLNP